METPVGMHDLSVNECWMLLRSAQVGRLAVVVEGGPEIFPVNFVVDHGTVVFRTAEGTKLASATSDEPVAFEADAFDPAAGEAWSVVIKGRAKEIRGNFSELFDALSLPLFPWHAGPKQHFVRVSADQVSGRRFRVVDPEFWGIPAIHKSSPD
ncbi:MAG: pyridoxamine 5'-phosphate oxidase family protein [Actinomycetota bacterium]